MNKYLFVIVIAYVLQSVQSCYEDPTTCDERVFDRDSFVCVCDAEYCDVVGDVTLPEKGSFKRVISSRETHRFRILTDAEEATSTGDVHIKVDYGKEYQTVIGFGGAFTDSTGIGVASLSKEAQEVFLRSYFSKDGLEYNLCRIPIAGTDFSTHPYSYDEVHNDVTLEHFALTKEDFLYKIPLIQKAKEMSSREIRLFASPWSPPPWMKENGKHNGKGGLLKEMWDPYSNYMIKFVEEYLKNNISLWGLTTINEPTAGFQDWPWNACAWSAEDMRDWVKTSFGPALEEANMRHLQVMVYEHGRNGAPTYPATILRNEEANKYVSGIAFHWYDDWTIGPEVLTQLQNEFKDKFLLYTEACLGFEGPVEDKVQLGSWERAQVYASDIIENLNHYSAGWVDWNLALNMEGGPNWAGNAVDSPIIINTEENEFYKQPMFYAMGHFSKFMAPGSKRVHVEVEEEKSVIQATASFDTQNNSYIYVVLNKDEKEQKISIQTPSKKFININMNSKSLETILIKN